MTITLKQIDKAIAAFATSAKAVNVQCHEVGMMIFRHAAPKGVSADCEGSGDCTRAVKLVRAMPASFRRTMMIEWFHKNTPIRIKLSENGDKCEYDPKYKKLSAEEKLTWWNIENANTEAFYDIAEATPEAKPLDFAALVKLVEQLSKRISTKVERGEVNEEDVPTALALSERLSKMRIVPVKPANDAAPAEQAA